MLIVRDRNATVRLERQPFETEAALQKYIYDSPEAIPLDEISPGAKLFVLGREFPTGSGPIDVLGTDQDGHPYIIETKLYRNPDKRVVVAQVLDYAAALWNNPPTPDRLLEALRADAAKRGAGDPVERLSVFLGEEETSGEAHLTSIADALKSGGFTAVVLMDRVEERLRNLIRFLNENSQFRFVAVELDYYRHGTAEIVNPRLFGAEVRRPFGGSSETRGRWDEAAFFERLAERAAPETVSAARRYCDFASAVGPINWGSGRENPSCNPYIVPGIPRAPLKFTCEGDAIVKLSWLMDRADGLGFAEAVIPRLEAAGLPMGEVRSRKLRWGPELWVPKVDAIISAFQAGSPGYRRPL